MSEIKVERRGDYWRASDGATNYGNGWLACDGFPLIQQEAHNKALIDEMEKQYQFQTERAQVFTTLAGDFEYHDIDDIPGYIQEHHSEVFDSGVWSHPSMAAPAPELPDPSRLARMSYSERLSAANAVFPSNRYTIETDSEGRSAFVPIPVEPRMSLRAYIATHAMAAVMGEQSSPAEAKRMADIAIAHADELIRRLSDDA